MENVKSSSDLHLYPYFKYKNYTLFPWPCLVNDAEGHFKKMKEFSVRDDDVLLCTIPKSDTLLTGWFNYTKEFTEAIKQHNNIHQVLYEDLKMNPNKQVKQLAEFLNVSSDDDFISKVVDACSFNQLKDKKHDASTELNEKSVSTVFRKGQMGEWKEWFTVAQNEKFDKLYEEEMKGVDITLTYENP